MYYLYAVHVIFKVFSLIGVEYQNWRGILYVYLLSAILLAQIYEKLNCRHVTYKLASLCKSVLIEFAPSK